MGHFRRSDPFTLALRVMPTIKAARAVLVHHSRAPIDAGSRGYELLLEDGRIALGLHHMWPGNSLKVRTTKALTINEWSHIAATYDGSSRASGVRLYIDGKAAELEVVRDSLWKDIAYGGSEPDLALGYRFRDNGFKGGRVASFKIYSRAVTPEEAGRLAGRTMERTSQTFASAIHEPTRKAVEQLRLARRAQAAFIEPIPEVSVMRELPAPKPAFVLKRGAYDAHGERVTAGTPAALPPFPPGAPRNRLGLARWLLQPDHPLTARVAVNRLWQQMFGRGIVETSENFGRTGTPPTHPELLDWLARDFVEHGWDAKRTLRMLALSATYRQDSRAAKALREKDPHNHMLARTSPRRLTAEMLRDQALALSGLLAERVGGPSVYPYQPEGLWNEAMGRPRYPQSRGEGLHRRSLYTFWKRTVPHPQLTTFDAADRSTCTVRRQPTSTPLQALALLNDVQMAEAARFLGARMLERGGTAWLFRAVTGRQASERERAILDRMLREQRAEFAKDPAALRKWLLDGCSSGGKRGSIWPAAAAVAPGLAQPR